MKPSIQIIYLHVLAKSSPDAKDPSFYDHYNRRFAETYANHPAGVSHTLRVVFCGRLPTGEEQAIYDRIPNVTFDCYTGPGWDIGAHQDVSRKLDCDLVYCLATPVHFRESNWLTPIVDAWERYGDGLYGPMGSYENMPHIRTSAFAFSPETMRQYPHLIDSRETCFHFESGFKSNGTIHERGEKGFTNWMLAQGKPVLMVTRDQCYTKMDWRKPANIFRRGDQSNCLVFDRHCDIYAAASPQEKLNLEAAANTLKVL